MTIEQGKELLMWIFRELNTISHGEVHITFKVRDGKVALIEKSKIIKVKPE
jgi:hypothetical protein